MLDIRIVLGDFRVMFTKLPCPFCGGDDSYVKSPQPLPPDKATHDHGSDMNLRFWVECNSCHARGPATLPIFESVPEADIEIRRLQGAGAIQSWNIRHPNPKPAMYPRACGARGCPFCGSEQVDFDSVGLILCSFCGAQGPLNKDFWLGEPEDRIELWNKRTSFIEPFSEIGDGNFRASTKTSE